MTARRAIFIAPFDALSEPGLVAELAVRAVADPWVAARWPNKRPLKRAARYDGVFPIDLPGPDELAELVAEVGTPGDVVVTNPAGTDPAP